MKKFLSVFLTAALAVSMLAGCGSKNETVTAKVIDIDLTNEEYAFGVDKNQPELLEKTNEFIAKIKSDGTLDEICKKYFSDGEPEAVKSATLDTSKDQLVVATNAAFEPFEYTKGEDYYGIDMEIAKLLADELGKELVIENMDFDAVCLSVSQQKCDIAMAGLTINEEREEYVTFTDSYYSASQRLIVPAMLQHSMIARQQMTLQLSLLRQNHLTRSVFSREQQVSTMLKEAKIGTSRDFRQNV